MRIKYLIVISFFLIIVVSVFISACSCNCGKENFVQGYITVIGHEPFTKLAVRTDDDKTFVLQLSKELNDELWKKQGSFYYIVYGDLREQEGVSTILVEKVIPITKNEK
jgi:hypothetical protein